MIKDARTRYRLMVVGLTLLLSIISGGVSLGQNQISPATDQSFVPRPTDSWAVVLAPGSDPNVVAAQLGYRNMGQIAHLPNTYLFTIRSTAASGQLAFSAATALARNSHIVQFTQQYARQQVPRDPTDDPLNTLSSNPTQWYLWNHIAGYVNLDVLPTWHWNHPDSITGSGVQIAIVDDGLQYDHPDLQPNYNAAGSWDFNGNDSDPAPFTDGTAGCNTNNCHGTAVAGVAAAADNPAPLGIQDFHYCGVGVAFGAHLSGIRLIAGPSTDQMEADALTYNNGDSRFGGRTSTSNDIYSSSWGPSDNGATLQAPGQHTHDALQDAVKFGRGGLGNIYVWAAGNGGSADNINADGYANSRFVIAVGAVGVAGRYTGYSEPGAAMLVTAPSSDATTNKIATTDLLGSAGYNFGNGGSPQYNDCTDNFTGTSATAPQVAGVVALMLQANPNLTWRDVQYILANTAVKNDPFDPDWTTNAAGYHINHKYGFGLVDATAAVNMARTWTNVAPEMNATSVIQPVNQLIPSTTTGASISSSIVIPANIIVEHVEVVFNATVGAQGTRGAIEVILTAPSGTVSHLMTQRVFDNPSFGDNGNFANWKFMTVQDWGENSAGTWTLTVLDHDTPTHTGTFQDWQLIVYGTPTAPRPVTVTAPPNGTIITTALPQATVNLTWTTTNVFADHLELLLDTVNPPVNMISLPGTPTNYLATLPLGTYYWQIRAVDGSNASDLSPLHSFSIVSPTSGAPTMNYFTVDTPTLTWNAVTGAISYELQISRNLTFTDLVTVSPLVVPAATLTVDTPHLDDGIYYWRVRACTSAAKCGDYSAIVPITIDAIP